MTGLLSSHRGSAPCHGLRDVPVPDRGNFVRYLHVFHSLEEPQVAHDRNYGAAGQGSALFHVTRQNGDYPVTIYHAALFVDGQNPIRVSVERESHVVTGGIQIRDARRAAAFVNIRAGRIFPDHREVQVEVAKRFRGRFVSSAVRAVEQNLRAAAPRINPLHDEVHVTLHSIVHRGYGADIGPGRLRRVLFWRTQQALQLTFFIGGQFATRAGEKLHAVVRIRIV